MNKYVCVHKFFLKIQQFNWHNYNCYNTNGDVCMEIKVYDLFWYNLRHEGAKK